MGQDFPGSSCAQGDGVAKVRRPCASLRIRLGSFFALLRVDGQEVPPSSFTSGELCCPLVQACFAVLLAQCIKRHTQSLLNASP